VNDSLIRRQVAPAIIEDALQKVQNKADSKSAVLEYMQKRCGSRWPPTDPKDVQKLIMHMCRRGFDRDSIFDALKDSIPAAALQRFETGE
jgi:SOS response regulatory protein OraA/RecX